MRRIVLTAFLSVLLAGSLTDPGRAADAPREIVVTGEGRVEVEPDMATIRAGVESQADSASDALAANARSMRAVIAALEEAGIAAADMQTSQILLEPVYRQRESGVWTAEVVAYIARNTLTVRIRAVDAVGEVIDAMMAAGLNRIESIGFGLAEMRPPLDEARAEAVRDGRAKAELFAASAGVRLGDMLALRETQPFDQPFPAAARMEAAMDGAIAEGSLEILSMVEIVYAIDNVEEER